MGSRLCGAAGGESIMRLAECDGKALLRRHGLAVPRGVLLRAGEPAPAEAAGWAGHMLKAQVLEGGRGKRGLVRRLARAFRAARDAPAHRRRPRGRRCADPAGRGGRDRPGNLSGGADRRHAPVPRTAGRAGGRRGCRAGREPDPHSHRSADADDPRQPLSRTAGGVPARPGLPARPLCGAAAGDRAARGSGTAGDQSAGADQGRPVRRLRRQGHPRRQRGRPPRPRRSLRSAARSKGAP